MRPNFKLLYWHSQTHYCLPLQTTNNMKLEKYCLTLSAANRNATRSLHSQLNPQQCNDMQRMGRACVTMSSTDAQAPPQAVRPNQTKAVWMSASYLCPQGHSEGDNGPLQRRIRCRLTVTVSTLKDDRSHNLILPQLSPGSPRLHCMSSSLSFLPSPAGCAETE